ncbi:uncharacterized protein UV8b_04342 [Ustilaginoidea virens]|uniref:Structural maintenance of chromosomes protein 5 n=1 Tax=Ustilaginoidea virens TaxID=1159556 RepID=A0A8E5MHM3_USTVR|nr:uncharacterized protein UV8b_04342 [Ustilaginoidea virens]QUC20101.1 hypothetical protein UV8b_04342 [Ustilaginoidea virens]
MQHASSHRRRRSDMEDAEVSDDAGDGAGTPASDAKRRRVDTDLDSDGGASSFDSNFGRGIDVSSDGTMADFQPGAIVRVSVQNFVTYEKAEFFPGPHLNMVIGPNGTGKSSLVCAICLGLGYAPKHLGRAGSVKEFVKHGRDTATIEIELQKRPPDRSNYIVKVQIRREQNTQKWWLNGKETTHKKIQDLMQALKIQVDNLCQFLPQDRVVEFAGCTPVDLLHETLRAAAPEEMLQWQAELQDLHREKKSLADSVNTDVDELRILENRQQGLQADVDRIREREEIQQKVQDLESALVVAQYEEARDNYGKARHRKKEAERTLRRLESESGPSLEAINEKEAYARQIEAAIPSKERALKGAETATQSVAQEIIGAVEEVKEMGNKLEAEVKGFESKKKELASSRSKITSLQADLKNQPADFNPSDWNQKIRAEEHNLRELEAENRQLLSDRDSKVDAVMPIQADIQRLQQELRDLDTQQGQQETLMRKHFPELAAGWKWIQEHQDEFEKEVFGPPMISCSVKDERYSSQIQALLQVDDLSCFTAQTKDDYKKLTDQLYRVMSLSVVVRTCSNPLSAFSPPVGRDEAAEFGLDGFAIDYLSGPEPVLAMLCAEKRLHQSGVSLREHDDDAYDRLMNSGKINQWAAGRQSFTIRRRREYGPQAMTTITKSIRDGRFWTSQPVNEQEREEIKRLLAEAQGKRVALREENNKLKTRIDAIDDQKTRINGKIEELRKDKSILQKEYQKWQSLPEKIEFECGQKAAHEQAMRDAKRNMQEIHYGWDKAVIRRSRLVLRHKRLTDNIGKAHQALVEAKIWLIEAQSDVEGLKDRNASIVARLEEERRTVQEATEEVNRAKETGRRLGEKVTQLFDQAEQDRQELVTQLARGRSSEDIEMEVAAEAAKLELIHAANPNVVREYERRAEEIAHIRRKMEGAGEKLRTLEAQLAGLMSKWEPRLEELVSKINDAFAYNFEQISCAGEVRIRKHDDFSQWALDVMVKFRENEALQQLTRHRQSGGERAVSTIFYLMSLQSMAQSPFRVVDEINQGMDPRNERMVHERMVEIACREHTSQYFLITPKLLTGLRYDPKMRVLCIASGERMPKEGRKLDFARCINVQKRLMSAA